MSGASGAGQPPAKPSGFDAVDARLRIVGAFAMAVVVVSLSRGWAMAAAVLFAAALTLAFRCTLRQTLRRLLAVDSVLVLVVVTLPFAEAGEPLMTIGPLTASAAGSERALAVLAKANAVALLMFTMVGTLDVVRFGRGLSGLSLPPALTGLLMLVGRYIEVLGHERDRLRQAMTARGFRPRTDGHTWRALGWLAGMVLVRAFDRAERVHGAMRCRGFRGELRWQEGARGLSRVDRLFALLLVSVALALIVIDSQ